MVKAHSPLASLRASGSLGGVLTFRRTRQGTAIVHTSKPIDPKSPAQLGSRALMRALQQIWHDAIDAQKTPWKPNPQSTNQEAYIAFLTLNLLQFRTYHAPLLTKPRDLTTLAWTAGSPTITPKVHALELFHAKGFGSPPYGYLIYRRENGTPNEVQEEFVHGIFSQAGQDLLYLDIVPTLNPYGYIVAKYDDNGKKSATYAYTPTAPLD